MKKFVWITGEGDPEDCYLIEAETMDEAYEIAIAMRIVWGNEDREDAEEWFSRNDRLYEIKGELKKEEVKK